MEKVFRKTGKVMNVLLLKRFCEGGVFGWWKTVAERVIQFSQPRPQVLTQKMRQFIAATFSFTSGSLFRICRPPFSVCLRYAGKIHNNLYK